MFGLRVSFSQQRQEQEENAAKLSRRQASALQQKNSVTALVGGHSEHSAEEDSESESEGVSGEGTKREEGKAQTASQGQEEVIGFYDSSPKGQYVSKRVSLVLNAGRR